MSVPQELGSAYLEITTKGLDKAKQDLAVLKSNLLDSAKGQDQFNSKLAETGKVADGTQSTFRGLVDSVGRWLGLKVPEKQVSIKADGLDQIEEGLTKLKKQAVGVKLDTRATEAPQPVHVSVIADKVHIAQPEPVKVPVEAAKPVAISFVEKGIADIQSALSAFKSPTLTVQAREEGIAKIQASLDALKPHTVDVPLLASGVAEIQRGIDSIKGHRVEIPVDAGGIKQIQAGLDSINAEVVKVPVEPPKPVTVSFLEKGIAEIQSALAALKSPTLTVEAREEGISKVQAALDALKPHAVDVPLLASGLADIQRGIDGIKVQPVTVPVKVEAADAPSLLKSAMGMAGKVKDGVASAFGAATASPIFQSIKSGTQAAIDGFAKVKSAIGGALDKATDVPVLRQLKWGISTVNTAFDDFLKKRYGKLAMPIKMSGMAVDMATMAAGMPIPGMSIMGTLPAMAGAEAHKQGSDYLGRRKARQEKGEAPTLLDKGVNLAVGATTALASKIKSIPLAPLVTGLKAVGSAAVSGFGLATSSVGNFLGKLNAETLAKFGERLKEVGAAVANSIQQVGSVATRGFAILTGGIGAAVRMADPVGFQYFTAAVQGVSIQIGRIFVPLLREITTYIIRLEGYLRGLNDTTRASILHWAKVAIVVLGSVMAFSQLFSIVSTGFTVLSSFVGILTALGLSTPVGWVIALAAAIAALVAVVAIGSGGMGGLFAGLRPALDALLQAFQSVFAAIMPIISDGMNFITSMISTGLRTAVPFFIQFATLFADTVGRLVGIVQPIISALLGQLLAMYQRLQPVIQNLLTGVMGVFQAIFGVATRYYAAIAPIIGSIIEAILPLFEQIYAAYYGLIGRLLPIVSRLVTAIGTVLIPIMQAVWGTIKTVIGAIVPIFQNLIAAVTPIIEAIIDVFGSIIEAVEPLFGAFGEGTGILETLIGVLVNVVLMPFRMLGFILGVLVPVIRWFASGIAFIAAFLAAVIRPAFQGFADMMNVVNVGFRRVINGLIDVVNGFIAWYNAQDWLPGTLNAMDRIGEANVTPTTLPAQNNQTPNPNQNFQGEVRQPMQLSAIAEAWRKAQTATTTDPNTALLQQQVNQTGNTNNYLQQILGQLQGSSPNATFGN